MINTKKIKSHDVTTHQHQHDYKTKKIKLPVDILYTKDAIAGRRNMGNNRDNNAIPVNYGTRVYIGKEANRSTFVAIKEVVVKHKTRSKYTDHTDEHLNLIKTFLLREVQYMRKVNSACGPITQFYNQTGTRLYVIQNLMTGTATDTLDSIRPTGDLLPLRSTVLFMCTLAARHLQELHDKNVLHFDIKPLNLMYSKQQNRVEFIDYGLSRSGPIATPMSRGTPAYASASQAGLFDCTARDEIVSLGVTFIELMTKQYLFSSRSDGLEVNHNAFLYRNRNEQDSRITANISRVMTSVRARHPLFENLCERMVDNIQNPDLTAGLVYGSLKDMVQELDEQEYSAGVMAWKNIPNYVERIQSRIDILNRREQELNENQ